MKKLLILVLSIMLVAGAFTAVYASDGGMDSVRSAVEGSKVILGGDMRVRGVCKINHDLNDSDNMDDDDCSWDQRVRLKITAQITGGVEVRVRLNAGENDWGTGSGVYGSGDSSVTTDYAYMHIPIGSVVVDAGQMPYNWGNKFLVWDERVDRLAITGNSGNVNFGVFGDKIDENFGPDGFLDDDMDQYGGTVVFSGDNVEAGAIVVWARDEASVNDDDGFYASIFYNGTVGDGVGIKAEVAALGGDLFETQPHHDSPWGGFISAEMGRNALTFGLELAYAANTYVADDHYTPTVMIGTDNPSALADFGANNWDSLLIAGTVGFAATPEFEVYGRLAYVDLDKYEADGDGSAWEVDAGLGYQLATNTRYTLDVGYLSPDDLSAEDDAATSVTSKIEVYF
jgi:hypothetical protein